MIKAVLFATPPRRRAAMPAVAAVVKDFNPFPESPACDN